jgi:probable phosphoglycerate mutase
LRVLAARWLELPPVGGRLFYLGAGAISVLGWEHDTPVLQMWNRETDEAMWNRENEEEM